MKITKKEKGPTLPKPNVPAMKAYKKSPGSLNAAAFAAHFKAKQLKTEIVVIEGNSMGHRVYHLARPDEDLRTYTARAVKADVMVVNQKGETWQAVAESKPFKSYQEILIEGMDKVPLTPKEREECKARFGNDYGCTIAKNKRGEFFAFSHRARTKFYPTIAALPKDKVKFIASTS